MGGINKLGFDIVHGCQLRCVGCPNSTINPKIKFMSVEDFDTCLKNLDVDYINLFRLFNFGEALLHPEIIKMTSQIHRQAYDVRRVEISTNAQYFDKEVMIELFKRKNITDLAVSCDGNGTKEEYERLRPPAKWERLIEFFQFMNNIREEYASSVRFCARVICEGEEGKKKWRSILEPMGWDILFRDWIALPMSIENPSKREVSSAMGLCYFTDVKFDVRSDDFDSNNFYVDYDGSVVPCCIHPRATVFGNLRKQKYTDIMRGHIRLQFIEKLKCHRHEMEICSRCEM